MSKINLATSKCPQDTSRRAERERENNKRSWIIRIIIETFLCILFIVRLDLLILSCTANPACFWCRNNPPTSLVMLFLSEYFSQKDELNVIQCFRASFSINIKRVEYGRQKPICCVIDLLLRHHLPPSTRQFTDFLHNKLSWMSLRYDLFPWAIVNRYLCAHSFSMMTQKQR